MTSEERSEKLNSVLGYMITLPDADVVRILIDYGHCPDCGSSLVNQCGCRTCFGCGWSQCG